MKKTTLFLLGILFSLSISAQTPFYFIQLTDPQFGMIDKNASFDKETALMEKAVKQINKLNPGFVVVTGDLVNDGNNADQIKEFKRILATLRKDIPVYLIPGNHDVGQQPTSASLAGYIDTYGYDCFSFQMNGTCFIGINTQIIWADVKEAEKSQLVWLTKVLENSQKCTHRILFGHHPVFVHSADEADKYDNFPLAKRNDYLNLFNRFNVSDQFAGHLHYNSNGQHGNFRITGTSAVGMQIGKEKSGLRIVKVYPDKVESTYYPLDEVPAIVEL